MNIIELICPCCKITFTKEKKTVVYLLKKNPNKLFFCSKQCFVNMTERREIEHVCLNCSQKFITNLPKKVCCSTKCARKYAGDHVTSELMSSIMKDYYKNNPRVKKHFFDIKKKCVNCSLEFEISHNSKKKCCSIKCSKQLMSLGARRSVKTQNELRRSKNEIEFYNLCKNNFSNVESNIAIFNGWDADVIIHDKKIAILWNGKWHYEKITLKHSVEQVQTRDKIKVDNIIKCGYIPYIIKDMGSYDVNFVNSKFNEFKQFYDSMA